MVSSYKFLIGTCVTTACIIAYVHWDQKREIKRMRDSVYVDAARERSRREAVRKEQLATTQRHSPPNSGVA